MQLTYRGVSYDYTPAPVSYQNSESVGFGKYRGLDWRFRNPKKALVLETNLDLKYRGVAYHTGPESVAESVTESVTESVAKSTEKVFSPVSQVSQPVAASAFNNRARMLMQKRNHNIKVRQQAMLERSVTEVGLDTNVSAYWNRIQGKVHPTFRLTYDRGGAVMS